MTDVAAEEEQRRELEVRLTAAQNREVQLLAKLSELKAKHATAICQLKQQALALAQLQHALEAADDTDSSSTSVAARHAAAAVALELAQKTSAALQSEVNSLRNQLAAVLAKQQSILDELAARDERVAELATSATDARVEASRQAGQVLQMEGVLRATGERAAAAEQEAADAKAALARCAREAAEMGEK